MATPKPARIVYILYRYPQLSQTFVRDEIFALRQTGASIDVVSLYDPGGDCPSSDWAGPYVVARRPAVRRIVKDLTWWATHHPRRLARFLRLIAQEPWSVSYVLARLPSLARRLHMSDISHVHTHFAWSTATEAAGTAVLLACTRSITVHARDIYAQPARIVRRRLRCFDQIVTVCQFNVGFLMGARLLEQGAPSPRVIPCGVAADETPPARCPTTDIVTVGRLVEKKGFDVLLRAVVAAHSVIPVSVTIVGDGPDRAVLERLRNDLGLASVVTFAGALPHAEALASILSARLFCLPSRRGADGDSDAMPVVIREAMARGVPVVASRLAGIPESIDDDVGWLVEPDSFEELAVALQAALGDESERHRRGLRGHARARSRWRFESQAEQLLDVFAEAQRAKHQRSGAGQRERR